MQCYLLYGYDEARESGRRRRRRRERKKEEESERRDMLTWRWM